MILGSVLTIVSIVPYVIDVIKKKTKPKIVSWFTWTLLTAIATFAAIDSGDFASAILTGVASVGTLIVAIIGYRLGDKKFERFDIGAQIGAIVGLLLWLIFNTPLIALIATVGIDFLAALPTVRHAWLKPKEETAITFLLSGLGSLLILLSIDTLSLSGLLFPIYLTFMNLAIFLVIKTRGSKLQLTKV